MNHLFKISRTKLYAAVAVITAFILAVVLIVTNTGIGLNLFPGRANPEDYHLILDEDNAVSSSGTVTHYTEYGHYGVEFSYTNVQGYENGHTRINAGGKIVNADHILSITEISATFVTNGSLKFRASYDGATWGGYTNMVSGEQYDLGTRPYYIEFSTDGTNYVNINTIRFDYSCTVNPDAAGTVVPGSTVWKRVNSNSELSSNDEVVLVGKYSTSYYYALRAQVQNNYYLYCDEITVNSGEETCEVDSQNTFILSAGSTSGTWRIKHGDNYIRGYTSGTHKNVGITTTYNANECDWSFEFSSSVVSFYNPGNSLYLVYDYYNKTTDEFKGYEGTYTKYTHLLYKKVVTESHTDYPTPIDCVGFTATNDWIGSYTTNNIFDESKNLNVKAVYNDNSTKVLSLGGDDGYSYYMKNSLGQTIDTSAKFPSEGVYTLVVEYKDYLPVEIEIVVGEYVYVEDVSASMTKVVYNTSEVLGTQLEGNLTANIEWSNDVTDSDIAYSEFESHGLAAKLMNISGISYDMSKPFGTAGLWTMRVYATGNEQLYYDISLTVEAIPVTSVTIDGDSTINLEVDGTAQLTVTVGPENATNKTVSWASGNEAVATVEDGKVTGVSVGTTIITATSQDGTNKYGSVNVNVTEKTSVEDEIVSSDLAATGTTYTDFSGVTKPSGAVYAGNSALNGTSTIQLLSKNSNSGIVSTTSGGKIKTVTITWASTTTTTRYIDIYASNSAYSDASDLYGASKIDGLEWPGSATSQTYTFTSDYEYVGIRSRDGAAYLSSVKFGWGGSGGSTPTPTPDPVYPTSISVSGNNAITISETSQLTVGYSSGTTVMNTTYSSSNESVATVSPTGLVTGVAQGTAVITASAQSDNSGHYVTATITITVSPIKVTSVSLDTASTSVKAGKTVTLVATVYPTSATNKSINWSSSDTSVATVSNGVVTGVAAGTATITVTTVDQSKTATCTVTVTASAGGEETFSITYTDLPSAYSTTDTVYTAESGIKFQAYNCAGGYSSKMQFKASAGYLQNTESLELQSVTINGRESNTLTVYGSNTAGSSSTEIAGDNDVYDLTGYNYFKIARTASGAAYCSSITVLTGTPTPTDPTNIIMSQTTAEVRAGGTVQLSVSYVPSNANQHKDLGWTSSNTNVATVSDGLVSVKSTATAGQTATITARLSSAGFTQIYATCTITVVEQQKDDHTVLIYLCGSNLESDYASSNEGLATGDIEEILKISGQPDDVNIVIQTGGSTSWSSTYGISSTKNQRYHVENRQLVKDTDAVYSSYTSMGLTSTLQSFIEYGLNNYPAERTGLVLWNHGGAMRGVCYDEKKSDDNLVTTEVSSAVSGALNNCGMAGQKLEWIGYDACLMQVQDIASINADYFNYMIASEESEAGYGWDYDTWVDDLYAKKTTPVILKAIVDGFIKDNGGTSSSSNDQTLSYLNLSKMSAYLTAWNNMSTQLGTLINKNNKSSFNSLVTSCKHYADSDYTYYGTFDAKDFINKLSSNSTFNPGSTYTQAVLDAFADLVAYSSCGKGAGNSNGLCLFWSCSSNCQKGTYYTASMTKFTAWRTLVTTYGS